MLRFPQGGAARRRGDPGRIDRAGAGAGVRTYCGYGLTEFASTVCAKEADGAADVGAALPGREMKIVAGEVWLRAASMAAGYWRDGQLLPLTNDEGWFATRDRGEIIDGRLTLLGRWIISFSAVGKGSSRRRWNGSSGRIRRYSRRLSCRWTMRNMASVR